MTPIRQYKVRVGNLSGAFELLAKEPGVTVNQNRVSFLPIETAVESIPAVNAVLVTQTVAAPLSK